MNAFAPVRELYDVEVEQALIGAALVDNTLIHDCTITAEDFYDPLHQRLWCTILELLNAGERASPLTVANAMGSDPGLNQVGGRGYLGNLSRAAPVASNINEYCRIIRDWRIRRELIRECDRVADEIGLGRSGSDLLSEQLTNLQAIAEGSAPSDEPATWYEAGERALKAVEARKRGEGPTLQPLGIAALDEKIGGVEAGELIILAGRPGMGKTAVAIAITHATARTTEQRRFDLDDGVGVIQGKGVYIASLEMRDEQLMQRGLSMLARAQGKRIPYTWIRNARIRDTDQDALLQSLMATQAIPVVIDQRGGMTLSQIAMRARRAAARFRKSGQTLGLVVIDHLQLIEPEIWDRRENDTTITTRTSKALKALAKALKVPVLCLCQLNRSVEGREDKRPMLSDLRQSGSIEQDADMVIFVHRPEYYLTKSEPDEGAKIEVRAKWQAQMDREKDRLHLIVAKYRQGAECSVTVECDMACNWIGEAR